MARDPRVDDYISRQADFARPILEHLRALVHAACPETEEAIKWGMPAFLIGGKQFAQMAGFKAHAVFGFWNSSLVMERTDRKSEGMGQFGRLTRIEDLPDDATLKPLIRTAAELRKQGVRPPRAKPKPRLAAPVPHDLRSALDRNPAAAAAFDGFAPSAKRDYSEWIEQAKRPETRARRVAQAIDWIAEGKRRNWKYEKS